MIQKIVLELIEGPIVFIENVQVQPPDLFTNWRAKIATFIGTPHLLDGESEPLATWLDMDMETFGLKVGLLTRAKQTPYLATPFPGNPSPSRATPLPGNLCNLLIFMSLIAAIRHSFKSTYLRLLTQATPLPGSPLPGSPLPG